MPKPGIRQPLRRTEDLRFLTGAGRFIADIELEGMAHGLVLRSPHAHARINAIDSEAAARLPGVLAVFTGADWQAEGLGDLPTRTPAKHPDGAPVRPPPRPGLVRDRVRFVGDAVAFIVAETMAAAQDAAELIEVDYEPLPAVTDARKALEEGTPLVWDHVPGNLCLDFEAGDEAAVEAAFGRAHRVVSLDVDNNRVTTVPMETRGAIGRYDRDRDHFTLITGAQNVHVIRDQIAEHVLHVPRHKVRHLAHDVGGGFGAKNALYPEYALVLMAARRLGRPVGWIDERSDSFLSDSHGRDQSSRVELALDADGRFLGLKVRSVGNVGAYVSSIGPFTPTGGTARTQGGVYRIPALYFRAKAAFTNTGPVEPYRGAGRPEATYQIERVIDVAARELGVDPVDLRRRNLIRAQDLPYRTGIGLQIDSGAFETVLDRTLKLADWNGFAARAAAARARGRRRGISAAPYLGLSGGRREECAALSFDADGTITLAVGAESAGTGHETVFPQILADRLGVPVERIRHRQADTDLTPTGSGHGGSHGLEVAGSTILIAADGVIEKAKPIAGYLLEAAPADIAFADGRFTIVGTDRSVTMTEVIAAVVERMPSAAGAASDLDTEATETVQDPSLPNGCHVAEVEVDPETGQVALVAHAVVHDLGPLINPVIVDGQVMGATAQGIGQALLEQVVYEEESGQPLTGSLMDYTLPRAYDLPNFRTGYYEDAPTARNPLGVKGVGEAGCGGAPPAIVNAVIDALADLGVRHIAVREHHPIERRNAAGPPPEPDQALLNPAFRIF
ncbi:MAG: xanthine dehydrogenase family protein molybdopterin-binding subunit [Kiloniellales bacterium]